MGATAAVVLSLCLASVGALSSRLTEKQVDIIKRMVAQKISSVTRLDAFNTTYYPLIPGFVRLAFHACIGVKCGGCLNVNFPNINNNGLDISIQALEQVLADMQGVDRLKGAVITRADLWALAAAVAFKKASAKLGKHRGEAPEFTIVFGRQDCPTAPYTNDDTLAFPNSVWGIDSVLSFFAGLGFSAREAVALIGMHSLGVIRDIGTPAVVAQWDRTPSTAGVNFYQLLVNRTIPWRQVPLTATFFGSAIIYAFAGPPGPSIMLNTDVSLVANLSIVDDVTGLSSCNFTQCQPSATAEFVHSYAQSVELWLSDVVRAMNKLITRGYPSSSLYGAAND